MHIRKFRAEDAFEVSSLIRRAISRRDNRGYSIDNIFSIANHYSADTLKSELKDKDTYVAIEGNKIVGTGTVRNDELMTLFIEPDCQSKGIGSIIMAFLENVAISKGVKKLWGVSTISAVSFYELLGYKCVGEKMHSLWGKGIFVEKNLK